MLSETQVKIRNAILFFLVVVIGIPLLALLVAMLWEAAQGLS